MHDGQDVVGPMRVGSGVLTELALHARPDVLPVDGDVLVAVWSRLLMGNAHRMEHLMNRRAAIVAAGRLQVQFP